MKITIANNNKLIPFEEIAEGTVFKVPETEDYCIKIASVVDVDTGEDEWNCLRLDNYTLDCCSPKYTVLPIDNAELIIP